MPAADIQRGRDGQRHGRIDTVGRTGAALDEQVGLILAVAIGEARIRQHRAVVQVDLPVAGGERGQREWRAARIEFRASADGQRVEGDAGAFQRDALQRPGADRQRAAVFLDRAANDSVVKLQIAERTRRVDVDRRAGVGEGAFQVQQPAVIDDRAKSGEAAVGVVDDSGAGADLDGSVIQEWALAEHAVERAALGIEVERPRRRDERAFIRHLAETEQRSIGVGTDPRGGAGGVLDDLGAGSEKQGAVVRIEAVGGEHAARHFDRLALEVFRVQEGELGVGSEVDLLQPGPGDARDIDARTAVAEIERALHRHA